MTVMIIQGKVENIFDNEDFARMLRDRLGEDAERYFREQTDPGVVLDDLDEAVYIEHCGGDCSKVAEIEEEKDDLSNEMDNLQSFLDSVRDKLYEIKDDFQYLGTLMTAEEIKKEVDDLITEVEANL